MSGRGDIRSKAGVIIIEGHVQGLANTRALGKEEIPVFVVDKNNCIARYSKYCQKFFKCPNFLSEAFIEFLIGLSEEYKLKKWLLLPSNDHAVYNLSKNKDKLQQYFKLITPDLNILNNIYDKINLIKIARDSNIPVPKTYESQEALLNNESFNGDIYLIKGRNGLTFYKSTGKKAISVNTKEELKNEINELKGKMKADEIYIQEKIPLSEKNKTISFTAFSVNGVIHSYWMGQKLREHPMYFGTATFTESVLIEDCLTQSRELLQKLNYTGICEVEYIKDLRDDKYKLIEINARTWLWVDNAIACGVNYPVFAYNYVNNGVLPKPIDYKTGLKWINYITDSVMVLKMLFKRKISIFKYFKSLKRIKTQAAFSWKDPLPGIVILIFVFYIARKRNIL